MAQPKTGPKKLKLSNTAVKNLAAIDGKKTRYFDTDVAGLFVRVQPSGTRSFGQIYRWAGAQQEMTIGVFGRGWTVEKARIRAREILNDVASGVDPKFEAAEIAAAKSLTINDLCDRYLEDGPSDRPDKRASSWYNDKSYLKNHVRPLVGKRRASDLSVGMVKQWIKDVRNGKSARPKRKGEKGRGVRGGPGAVAHSVRCFSACLGWAVEAELIPENPFLKIKRPQDGKRERYLTQEEAKRFFKALEELRAKKEITEAKCDLIEILFDSAARVSEILGLKWSEVDFERDQLVLPPMRHKTGKKTKSKRIVMTGPMRSALLRRRAAVPADAVFVFPSAESKKKGHLTTIRGEWNKLMKRSGIEDFRIHDIRHAYASFAINAGKPLKLIGGNLGHERESTTTERYAHLLIDARRDVAEFVSDMYQGFRKQAPAE